MPPEACICTLNSDLLFRALYYILVERGICYAVIFRLRIRGINILCRVCTSDRIVIVGAGVGKAEPLHIAVSLQLACILVVSFLKDSHILTVRISEVLCDFCLLRGNCRFKICFADMLIGQEARHSHNLAFKVFEREAVYSDTRPGVLTLHRHIKVDELNFRDLLPSVFYKLLGSLFNVLFIAAQELIIFAHNTHFRYLCIGCRLAQILKHLGIKSALVVIHSAHKRSRIAEHLRVPRA